MTRMWIGIAAMALAAGCAGGGQEATPARAAPAASPREAIYPPRVSVIGYSVNRRPIEMYCFGEGARPALIMAAIHGDEPTSATVARGVIELLQKYPQTPGNVPIVVIPVANPDGLAAGTRVNARQIDLNRNFPASNWNTRARSRRSFGGETAASEPETAALIATIERLQPRLIISIHSMENPCNNYDGPAKAVAELMSRYNRYPATPTIGYPTPGSMGSWAGIDKQIPMITLELPRRLPGDQAWNNNRDAILAAAAVVK